MKLLISFLIIFFLLSCQLQDIRNNINLSDIKKNTVDNLVIDKKKNIPISSKGEILNYIIGSPYSIEGVEYIPEENYDYNQIGLATFYNRELHNIKTINNDYNKVTELLGRHKTLPIPSIVKVTNLENGLSITVKINDRHNDNSSIIQVSRKVAQLLRFYKEKITKVRVEILSDPSKQMKIVTQSMNEADFNITISSAPTELVSIIDINTNKERNEEIKLESPIEIGFTEITQEQMFLKVLNFESYEKAKNVFLELESTYKFTIQNDQGYYSLIVGPLDNMEANNLVLSLISRGYKKTEFFLE